MHRIDTPNRAVDLFGAGKDGWRDGNKALGINPTEFNADMMNAVQEELAGIVEAVALTLNPANRGQVLEAITKLIEARVGDYSLDTGSANAKVVALNPAITSYTGNFGGTFKNAVLNTGACTIDFGAGAVSLVRDDGAALAAGDLPAGVVVGYQYIHADAKAYITSLVTTQALTQAVADAMYQSTNGAFRNLIGSANGISANVGYTADQIVLESAAGARIRRSTFSMTINTAAAGKNGLSTGALAANTWYAVFAGYDGAANCGWIDPSDTAPTVPAGVTHYARVGWIRTDGTGNKYPLSFKQFGKRVQYVVTGAGNLTDLPTMASGVASQWTAVGVGNFIPTTAAAISCVPFVSASSQTWSLAVAPNSSYPTSYSRGAFVSTQGGAITMSQAAAIEMLLESSNIYWGSSLAANKLFAFGWEDNL